MAERLATLGAGVSGVRGAVIAIRLGALVGSASGGGNSFAYGFEALRRTTGSPTKMVSTWLDCEPLGVLQRELAFVL
jgi:hypothetical protein